MCYAREIITETYKRLERALTDTSEPKSLLVIVRREQLDAGRIPESIRWVSYDLKADLNQLKDAGVEVLGAKLDATVAPHLTDPMVLDVRYATLAIVRNAVIPPRRLNDQGDIVLGRMAENPDMKEVSRLIGWALKYPAGMLRGDVNVARDILYATAASRARLSKTTGLMTTAHDALKEA